MSATPISNWKGLTSQPIDAAATRGAKTWNSPAHRKDRPTGSSSIQSSSRDASVWPSRRATAMAMASTKLRAGTFDRMKRIVPAMSGLSLRLVQVNATIRMADKSV
jgi:hypothetical protein